MTLKHSLTHSLATMAALLLTAQVNSAQDTEPQVFAGNVVANDMT